MANSANINAADLIRQQIANLQEVLAILEAKPEPKPAVKPQAKSVRMQTAPKTKPAKSIPADYKTQIDALKTQNDYTV